jgi:hypothetical protein
MNLDSGCKSAREVSVKEIKDGLQSALAILRQRDDFLLEHGAHERSVAHKLAEYLQWEFPYWHVDCEYNLHGINPKRLPRECEGRYHELVYPDINIHRRNTRENLVVFELKARPILDLCDEAKLIEFTKPKGDYEYCFGVFIGFNGLNKENIVWFRGGEESNI